ncbi:MAG: hypothetical protein LH614_15340 [Pyrinomonadaceae bacterium]|nr:hypothetical protein [Pyrinomonadaceae bacterium]
MSLKSITATVGEGAANIPADVATVQYLLNCVPASQGGPIKELVIDGFAGVVTIEAVSRFQKFRFGSSENRLQSGDVTFIELKKFDPLPFSAPVVPPNFNPLTTASMDLSKMNRSIDGGIKRALAHEGVKRTLAHEGIKRVLAHEGIKRA